MVMSTQKQFTQALEPVKTSNNHVFTAVTKQLDWMYLYFPFPAVIFRLIL